MKLGDFFADNGLFSFGVSDPSVNRRGLANLAVTFQSRSSMERAEVIEPGFSTADAEFPDIIMDEGDLVLRFKDWQEAQHEVFFSDIVAYKWQMIETFIEG